MSLQSHSRRTASPQGFVVCPLYLRLRPDALPCRKRRDGPYAGLIFRTRGAVLAWCGSTAAMISTAHQKGFFESPGVLLIVG
jgi:hypothetical protein